MQRVFCKSEDILSGRIVLEDKKQIHHLKDVLRLKAGDPVIVGFQKEEFICTISQISKDKIALKITEKRLIEEKKVMITAACAMPKKSSMDDIVDKLTQIGVDRIIPLRTERTVVRLDRHSEEIKINRWRKIALSAAEQSKRPTVPVISGVKNIAEVLREGKEFDLKLIPTLSANRKGLKEVLAEHRPKNILFFIGPEGDFTEEEILLAKESGCIPITLGESVLRVETAAAAVASFITLYENG